MSVPTTWVNLSQRERERERGREGERERGRERERERERTIQQEVSLIMTNCCTMSYRKRNIICCFPKTKLAGLRQHHKTAEIRHCTDIYPNNNRDVWIPTDWYGGRFVDGDDVIILVDDGERLCGDWRLVAVNSVDQQVIVLENCLHCGHLRVDWNRNLKLKVVTFIHYFVFVLFCF